MGRNTSVGYLPDMVHAASCIKELLQLYLSPASEIALGNLLKNKYGINGRNTVRMTRHTLIVLKLIAYSAPDTFEITESGKRWLENGCSEEELFFIYQKNVMFFGEILYALNKSAKTHLELLSFSKECGTPVDKHAFTRRMQVLKSLGYATMPKKGYYCITQSGKELLKKIPTKDLEIASVYESADVCEAEDEDVDFILASDKELCILPRGISLLVNVDQGLLIRAARKARKEQEGFTELMNRLLKAYISSSN